MCYVNQQEKTITSLGYYGMTAKSKKVPDTILGICWMKNNSHKYIVGSSYGRICCGDLNKLLDYQDSNSSDTANSNSNSNSNPVAHGIEVSSSYVGQKEFLIPSTIVAEYEPFEKLTSIHMNCSNQHLLISGYSTGAKIYDTVTSALVREYKDVHADHINISRFCNLSPHLLATSSFDGSIKTWDMRVSQSSGCIYTTNCTNGIVMINFSNDDNFILAAALDNELSQFLFVDGRKYLTFDVAPTGKL